MNRLAWRCEARPDPDRTAEWLVSNRVVGADGTVVSWVNPDHPGHPYPEAAALWLSWAAWRSGTGYWSPPGDLVTTVRRRLAADLARDGAVGRDGAVFLFDTCVAVDALARSDAGPGGENGSWVAPAVAGLDRFLRTGKAVIGDGEQRAGRWSADFGAHLVKAAALLLRADRLVGGDPFRRAAEAILARVEGSGAPEYGHALAYAAEGAILLRALGRAVVAGAPEAMAARFADIQRGDGAIPAWMDGSGPARGDTTAQAIRLWVAMDARRYRSAIEAAVAFLDGLRAPGGGLAYEPGSGDLNTWATLFADQAVAWARGSIEPLDWI